jgi:hypothetical protein
MAWVAVERPGAEGRLLKGAYWCVKCNRYRVDVDGERQWHTALRLPLEDEG